MKRLLVVALSAVTFAGMIQPMALAVEPHSEVETIELVGTESTRFEVNGRRYAGPLKFATRGDGISFTESASIEQYLQGIAEMPFSWHPQALAAQAIAARTYLARRLLGGRSGDEARYEFDICATNLCQTYRGVQLVEGQYGDRWKAAVESTAGEVLVWEGRPIEAVYTANVGSRSRANQDVWASSKIPYLQPVDSPDIGIAPFSEWAISVSGSQFVAIVKADGYVVGGDLLSISVDDPPEGEGRATITIETSEGTDSILAPKLKGTFNRRGEHLFPGVLPARLGEGKLLPEAMLSYTYEITHEQADPAPFDFLLPIADRRGRDVVVIEGEGWGHGVGMSQWGAQIMAKTGVGYAEILSHYYTGTEPQTAPSLVPTDVVVGLDWGRTSIPVTIDGSSMVLVNGTPFRSVAAGEWMIRSTSFGMDLVPADAPLTVSLIGKRHWPR